MGDDDSLFDTTDWRAFLDRRLEQLSLTRRDFAPKVGRAPSWLSQVMGGRKLDPAVVPAMIQAMGLDAAGAEYFTALSELDNESPIARQRAWATVAATQRQRAMGGMQQDEALAISRWYVGATLELARCDGFRPEAEWIATRLSPKVTVEQATEALSTLLRLGKLVPDQQGHLVPSEMWSPSDLPEGDISRAIAALYQATIALGGEAVQGTRYNERHVSGATIAVSEEHFPRVVAKLRDLERELIAFAEEDPATRNRVYHIGVQFFPVSNFTDADGDGDGDPT